MHASIISIIPSKPCSKCKNVKLVSEFHTKGSPNKYASQCKSCANASKKNTYPENKDKIREVQRKCRERYKMEGMHSHRYVLGKLRYFKHKSKEMGLPFNLEFSDIVIPEYCPVLGIKLEYNISQAKDNSPSIDRIIPPKGYVKGNIVVVSKLANCIKHTANSEQIQAVANFYRRLGA